MQAMRRSCCVRPASFKAWLTASSTSTSAPLALAPELRAGFVTASRPVHAKRLKNDGRKNHEVTAVEEAPEVDEETAELEEQIRSGDADLRKLEKQMSDELSRLGLPDVVAKELLADEDEDEAVPQGMNSFDQIIRDLLKMREKGLLQGVLYHTFEYYWQKKSNCEALQRDIDEAFTKASPDQQEFLAHFVEFVKPVDAEAEDTAAAEAAAKKAEIEAAKEKELISFQFAPGDSKKVTVGKTFRFTPQDQKQFLPEGVAGQLKNTQFKFGDETVIFRRAAYDLIQELQRRQDSGFLSSANNDSIVLTGEGGSGKSTVLTQAVLWARKNDWLAVWIPDGRSWVGGDPISPSSLEHGHYDQVEKAARFAARLSVTHGDKLKAVKLKGDYEIEDFHRKGDSTLFDLLEFAYKNDKQAVNALYHFRRELNRITEFPTLIAVDRYNYLWDKTSYLDPADVNRGNFRRLDAQKLMLAKIFSNHQDHGLVNGTMACALETTKPATIKPYLRECGDQHLREIPPYTMNEFHAVMQHYKKINYVNSDDTTKATERYIYQLCNGLPGPVFKYCGAQ